MPDSGSAYLGDIYMAGFNFAPRGAAFCQGQLLPISTYSALYALLGTTFGGNGSTNFGLPDMRGRVPIGQGQGPGLSNYVMGQKAGVETVTLSTTQLPAHNHATYAVSEGGNTAAPANAFLANTGALDKEYSTAGTNVQMNPAMIGAAGGNQPHTNIQPYLALNFYIVLEGIFPSRN